MSITKSCLVLLVVVSVVCSKSISDTQTKLEKLETEYARVMIRLGKINNRLEKQNLDRTYEQYHEEGICVKNGFPCVSLSECCSEHCDFSGDSLTGVCEYNRNGFKYFSRI